MRVFNDDRYFYALLFTLIAVWIFVSFSSCSGCHTRYIMPDGAKCSGRGMGPNAGHFSFCDNGRSYLNPAFFSVTCE